jgi:hypothetical protein
MVRLKRVFARVWQPKYPLLCYNIFVDVHHIENYGNCRY